ncbi:MAG: IS630 family transposase [Chloroflexaceae bacterium]|nr:IS630 family transposase [Chloroflexaceae bacterium]
MAAVPLQNDRPVRVFAQDERRWNLRPIRRRRITARGTNLEESTVFRIETTGLFGAVDPTCGDGFWLILPRLTAATMQIFLDQFAAQYADSFNILILDNSRAHTAESLRIPTNVALVFQPPYCPEVNPVEHVWQDLRGNLAGQ